MTSPRYPYAPDEFDAPVADGAPVGVHRSPRGVWSKVWPFILVAVICAGLAVAAVAIMSQTGSTDADDAPVTQQTSAAPSEGTDATPSEEPTEAAPSDDPSATPTGDAADLDALLAAANLGANVRVLNENSGVDGAAGSAKAALEAQGFTNVTAANPTGPTGADGTVVWYTGDRADTAAAVAAVLGIPAEQVSGPIALREGDVVVILQGPIDPVG